LTNTGYNTTLVSIFSCVLVVLAVGARYYSPRKRLTQ
jgi:hypothetical protein